MRLYFAYGSNMDPEQMSTRCPDSDFCGVAWLSSYRFRINSRGVATVVPEEGAVVHGALWMISTRDEGRLDKYEGVAQGLVSTNSRQRKLTIGRHSIRSTVRKLNSLAQRRTCWSQHHNHKSMTGPEKD